MLTEKEIFECEKQINFYSFKSKVDPNGPDFDKLIACKAILSILGYKAVYNGDAELFGRKYPCYKIVSVKPR